MKDKKLAICVPYRNREQHLKIFVPYMTSYLTKKGIKHKIFICNQADDKEFNRGKIKNIAFDIARREGYDYFAFHDIDLLPEDDTADYSYPDKYPVHLTTYIDKYNYKLLYPENFGGCVMFTREQFEKINGYYNEYWGWGAEDDDLFWRCRKKGLLYEEYLDGEIGNKQVVNISRKNDHIKIECSDSLRETMNDSFSLCLLMRIHNHKTFPPYIWGDKKSIYKEMPILSKGFHHYFAYNNSKTYNGILCDGDKKTHELWIKRNKDDWTYLFLNYNKITKEMTFFLNGKEVMISDESTASSVFIEKPLYDTQDKPFLLGNKFFSALTLRSFFGRIFNEQYAPTLLHADIARVAFFNKAFTKGEVKAMFEHSLFTPPEDNLVLDYDFNTIKDNVVYDSSPYNNHGIINGCTIKNEYIGGIKKFALPFRRFTKYKSLSHKSESFTNKSIQKKFNPRNSRILFLKVHEDKINIDEHGLSNLDYKLVSTDTIFDGHVMLNVTC